MALWGGRFESGPDELFMRLNNSLRFDWRLWRQDIRGSIAWAVALERACALSSHERERLLAALNEIEAELAAAQDPAGLIVASNDEDIHSFVEARLIARIGDLGKKLHTGRSRNDQVATDLRLWVRDEIGARTQELHAACTALLHFAQRETSTVLPGYTHLQRAQPVLMAHWALAYVEMFERDAERFSSAARAASVCPLGSGALAGTAYPIDREALARDLGFERPTRNSLDGVSDRDFVLDTLAAAATCSVHLSRLAEDLIIYSSGEFAFVELSDRVTSGSSLMPQKKNPDALELLRGKCGRILGAHVSLLTTLKGLPLAYNKDLQEDKEPLFDAMEQLSMCLRVVPIVFEGIRVNREACLRAAKGGYSNATDLADYLVGKGVPFREAHEVVGRCVRRAIELSKALDETPIEELRAIDPRIESDVFARLTIEAGLEARDVPGGTAPRRVAEALREARSRLQ